MDIQRLNKKTPMLYLLITGIIGVINVYTVVSSMADDSSSAIVPCSTQSKGYDAGFKASDFEFVNVAVGTDNQLVLNTGNQMPDINNIVVPFDQEVAVTFVYENSGYELTRFGWMFATDVLSSGLPDTSKIRWVYSNINDNNNNGVMDIDGANPANRWGDRNGDGVIDAMDNKEVLGYFTGGTELVFVLDSSPNNGVYSPTENRGAVLYSKKAWNPPATQNPGGVQRMVQFYTDSSTQSVSAGCEPYDRVTGPASQRCGTGCGTKTNVQGWLDAAARTRLQSVFGLSFSAVIPENTRCINDAYGTPSQAMIIATPVENPNSWVLGVDDQRHSTGSTSDNDYNDVAFLIDFKTIGTAALKPDINAIRPDDPAAFFTSVTMEVFDDMPCAGKTDITYSVSPDNGATWTDITGWQEVRVSDASQTKTGSLVSAWTHGNPEITYRKALIDFASSGKVGQTFLWKAQMKSDISACVPKIINVNFSFTVAKQWVTERFSVSAYQIATGDGVTKTFTHTIPNTPIQDSSVFISDVTETFFNNNSNLIGNTGGTGTIDRFTGQVAVNFRYTPYLGAPITLVYSYYKTYCTGTAATTGIKLNSVSSALPYTATATATGTGIGERGFFWWIPPSPETHFGGSESGLIPEGGYGAGSFSLNLTGLKAGNTYHVKAYVKVGGQIITSDEQIFTTATTGATGKSAPTVITKGCTLNADGTLSAAGEITDIGSSAVNVYGFVYAKHPAPYTGENMSATGDKALALWDKAPVYQGMSFAGTVKNLTPGKWYLRAYAHNSNPDSDAAQTASLGYGEDCTFTVACTPETCIPGDVNGDGKVNLDDALLVLRILAGFPAQNININAELNGDGKIGLEELGFILQKVAGLR